MLSRFVINSRKSEIFRRTYRHGAVCVQQYHPSLGKIATDVDRVGSQSDNIASGLHQFAFTNMFDPAAGRTLTIEENSCGNKLHRLFDAGILLEESPDDDGG